eukprot:11135017-Alexandrium_andersonii.AAC.1
MSASLVGSEMCIRDSPSARRRDTAAPASAHSRRPPATLTKSAKPTAKACLLYTSDAADDM